MRAALRHLPRRRRALSSRRCFTFLLSRWEAGLLAASYDAHMLWVRIVFIAVNLLVFGAAVAFVYRRLAHDTTDSKVARRLIAGLLVLLFLAAPLIRFVAAPPAGVTAALLLGWGIVLYTLLALVLLEVVRFSSRLTKKKETPVNPERRLLLARAAAAGAVAVGAGSASFGAFRAFTPPRITEVPLKLPGLPRALDGFTIVQLSDIHVGAVIREHFLDQLVNTANGARPDLIAVTGDLVDGTPDELGRYVARLKNLQAKHGTFFVSGNHDYYSGWEDWAPRLPGVGFTVLRNRFVTIGDAGASFDLVGVDDWGGRWGNAGYDLEQATAGRDPERASVLLAHQPNGLELAAAKKIGLQLSGHTHGGQMFPGTLISEVMWGTRSHGLSRFENTQLYTSAGCGFVGPPVRVGAPPEVVKIVLVAG